MTHNVVIACVNILIKYINIRSIWTTTIPSPQIFPYFLQLKSTNYISGSTT